MSRVFKVTCYVNARGKRCKKSDPSAKRSAGKYWHAEYVDAKNRPQREPLKVTDKDIAISMLTDILKRVERERKGDRFVQHEETPLLCPKCHSKGFVRVKAREKVDCDECMSDDAPHVSCFRRHLQNKNDTPTHVQESCSKIARVFRTCQLALPGDITASRVDQCLADLRVSGLSVNTSNAYLQVVNAFCNWMVRHGRASENPLLPLRPLNGDADRRRERRALSSEEFMRLIDATRKSNKRFRQLSGTDRAMLYLTAAYTGLRAQELASLTELSLSLEDRMPVARVDAAYSKRRRTDFQPLRHDLVDELKRWLEQKKTNATCATDWHRRPKGCSGECPVCGIDHIRVGEHRATNNGWLIRTPGGTRLKLIPGAPLASRVDAKLWPLTWPQKAAEMIRSDLIEARAQWISESTCEADTHERTASDFLSYKSHRGEVFDFHALRHHFITSLGLAGIDGTRRQELARHSTSRLTDRYTHIGLHDVAGAIDALPPLPVSTVTNSHRATGTDGRTISNSPTVDRPKAGSLLRHSCAPAVYNCPAVAADGQTARNDAPELQAVDSSETSVSIALTQEPSGESESGRDLPQSLANPLFAGSNPAGAS
jgi:site-specific recombinase XerD